MSDIKFPATALVHWPGKPVAACEEHARQLQGLYDFMGGPLLARTPLPEPTECANCVNEEKKDGN